MLVLDTYPASWAWGDAWLGVTSCFASTAFVSSCLTAYLPSQTPSPPAQQQQQQQQKEKANIAVPELPVHQKSLSNRVEGSILLARKTDIMSDIGVLDPHEEAFLKPYLPGDDASNVRFNASKAVDRPFVTLTYASSLDSMIALSPGTRTTLSGPDTKTMTHYLRLRHDAILVGAGTAAVDDPSLNCRYPHAGLHDQPRPVIIDPNARWKVAGMKAHRLAAQNLGKGPWVVTRTQPLSTDPLLQVGGDYLVIDAMSSDSHASTETASQPSHMPWSEIFRKLKARGVNSVMVEGGATVINDLLTMPHLVDVMIVTIAPTFLGQGGVMVSPLAKITDGKHANAAWLQETKWRQFGNDVVLCGMLLDS